ncbi:PREDICTED: apoptotic protease-activating factor 1-like [Acropora digitifera]|uniref:apoptotic protease-activating factor 1-like n=1 Tax=Acropora digitifera TaxID=70779 RepID=UPI00077A1866|nr:PREDICTED: apoptotic protease-activating factor 1-like [Acropora digitifera]
MTTEHKEILTSNRVEIVTDLLVDDVLNFLRSKMVFDQDDAELIRAEKTSKRQAEKLLDLLEKKSDAAFYYFRESLSEPYPHLLELLQESRRPKAVSDVRDINARVENVLLEGGVPQRPEIFTNRGRELHKIRTALKSLKDKDGWVILHGMAGCGKTVLGSEALRDIILLEECFPGGVHWIRIGPVDQSKLLMRMQNLCARLDSDHSRQPPRNLEEAKDRLRVLFAHQYPRSLLILDDLWHSSNVKYFDIRCRILVTSRDAGIANFVGGSKAKVCICEGFTENESLQILAQWTKQPVNNLPEEAKEIFKLTNGSPLAISMIGALLRDHPKRWSYYVKLLNKRNVSKLKPKFEYEYPTLSEAIRMSINSLDDELRALYDDFVLFDEDPKVPAQVLCILWEEEFEVVEDWMEELVNKSLAKRNVKSEDVTETFYSIHNLQLTFLIEQTKDKSLEALHKKLVDRYGKVYKEKFSDMIDDGYIHWNLLRHMIKAGQLKLAQDLVTDLKWLAAKLKVTGPADLLNDYLSVKGNVDNMVVLMLFSVWDSGSGRELLNFAGHKKDVFSCSFSPDDRNVLSCSADNTVKVWNCETRVELITFSGHTDIVRCCCYSPDGSKIVSCSDDTYVKVWDSTSGKELFSLEGGTNSAVTFCCFKPTGSNIVGVSDTVVKIWDSTTGQEIKNLQMSSTTLSLAYSSDDSILAVGMSDTTVQLWNSISEGSLGVYRGHSGWVHCVTFSKDASKLVSASDDETVKIWAVDTTTVESSVKLRMVFDVIFSEDSLTIAITDTCNRLMIFEGETVAMLSQSDAQQSKITSIRFSCDGQKVAIGFKDGSVKILDKDSCKVLQEFKNHLERVKWCAFSQCGQLLVSVSDDCTVKVYSCSEGRLMFSLEGHMASVQRCMFFNHDNKLLVTSSLDGTLKVWNVHAGNLEFTCHPSHNGKKSIEIALQHFSLSTLQNWLQIVSIFCCQQSFQVWEASSGTLLYSLGPHPDCVRSASFSLDNQFICTGCDDGTIRVWNVSDGREVAVCSRHDEWVSSCVFSRDSNLLVSVSNNIKWWKRDGTLCQQFNLKGVQAKNILCSSDFKTFVSVDNIGMIYVLKKISP